MSKVLVGGVETMTNEEFQKLVIEKLNSMDEKISSLENSMDEKIVLVGKKLDAVYEQTAGLTEFRTEANAKLDFLIEDNKSIHELLGEHEVSIRTLRRKPV